MKFHVDIAGEIRKLLTPPKRKYVSDLILPRCDDKGKKFDYYTSLDGLMFEDYEDYVLHELGLLLSSPADEEGRVDPLEILQRGL